LLILSKACLFSAIEFISEISASYRGMMRQQVPEEFLKNKGEPHKLYGLIRELKYGPMLASVSSLVIHRRYLVPKPYLGASCKEHNTYIKV